MIVPTKIFIWVTPDEKMLGKSLEKKFLVFSFIFKLKFIFITKYFLTNNNKKKN